MLCCAIGLLLAALPWRLRVAGHAGRCHKTVPHAPPLRPLAATFATFAMALFLAHHLPHYIARAHASGHVLGTSILAQMLAEPLCTAPERQAAGF